MENGFEFISKSGGLDVTFTDNLEGTPELLFLPIEMKQLAEVIPSLNNTIWEYASSRYFPLIYNHYEFTNKFSENNVLQLIASIKDESGQLMCRTEPSSSFKILDELIITSTRINAEKSKQCMDYLQRMNETGVTNVLPYYITNGKHHFVFGFVEGSHGQVAISHKIESPNVENPKIVNSVFSVNGTGMFIEAEKNNTTSIN